MIPSDGSSLATCPDFRVHFIFILGHEIWHCALGHFARRAGRDPQLWNLAIDHEVNALLQEQGLTVPSGAILFPNRRGKNAERVYEHLLRRRQPPERSPEADHHEIPQTEPDAGSGVPVRDPDYRPATQAREQVWQDWSVRVVAAAQQIEQRHGTLPDSVRRIAEALRHPKIRWQDVLRRFLQSSHGTQRRWSRPNRRFITQGLYLPGRAGDHLDVAVAIDTSGSTTAWLPEFAAELNAIAGSFSDYRLRLIQCDVAVHTVTEHSPNNPLAVDRLTLEGGGGTDFLPVFDRLAEDEPPQALIFLTDGFGDAPSQPPAWPALWARPEHGMPPCDWVERLWLCP